MALEKRSRAILNILRLMISRHYGLATVLILIASAVCVRLGIWQIARFNEVRAFRDHVLAVQAMTPLTLPSQIDLTTMEYRSVTATGVYDFQNQIAIRDQYNGDEPGYHLITPLSLSDTEAVLVDRGWIPSDGNSTSDGWHQYDDAPSQVTINGVIRLGQQQAAFGSDADPTLTPNQTRLDFWVDLNIGRISRQIPYPVLPVYIELNPIPNRADPPIPIIEPLDLSDGSMNLNYVFQWNLFAVAFVVGYGYYLWRKELRAKV